MAAVEGSYAFVPWKSRQFAPERSFGEGMTPLDGPYRPDHRQDL